MKRLVLLFDGTWNSAANGSSEDITNVFRLNLAFKRADSSDIPQVTFYIPGPGSRGIFDKGIGGIFGRGIDQIIREAYVNISSNYSPGDEIYLFGFSRGAIAARALTCLIQESGLLQPRKLHKLAKAWKRFVSINRKLIPSDHPSEIYDDVHRDVRIDFVGIFDSVLGRNFKKAGLITELRFDNDAVSPIINQGFHIISADDARRKFRPTLWGDVGQGTTIQQVWMPGVHGDIGGLGEPKFVGTASLLTMLAHVKSNTSLSINDSFLKREIARMQNFSKISVRREINSLIERIAYGKHVRQPYFDRPTNYCHSVFDALFRNEIEYKEINRDYDFDHVVNIMKLPRYEGECDSLIHQSASRIINSI